ncbi:MAG TPA: folylpolyglutamate synthase/dihydrofolate synthase family protein [Pyrinomonadaceae bacterium]|nr:folylpolyglutamate synthase/dihydrofolate synthase family protein [Pyrinomonadaceae bacterium]
MLFPEALQYLLSLGHETLAMKLGLENIEKLLNALGQPISGVPKVQIAGTNGKGSAAVMLDAIMRAAGYRTGLYTSPHLISVTERMRIDGEEIPQEYFASCSTEVRRVSENLLEAGAIKALPTFFEQTTAIALLAFAGARIELAILETGLGGRLDATTATLAETVAITPVSFDHQEYLGNTMREIAAEKAAIIRPGVTAIVGTQPQEAMEVILKRCEECNVAPRFAAFKAEVTGSDAEGRLRVSFETGLANYENVLLGLRGRHQIENASIAIALAESLIDKGFRISRENIIAGLERARHAGRLDLRIIGGHKVLFDGAHNAAGAESLRAYMDEFVDAPITLIFGAMRDKDLTGIAATLFPIAQRIILTEPPNPRAATNETLLNAVPPGVDRSRIILTESFDEAFRIAQEKTPSDGLICITGSLYLVGEGMVEGMRDEG